MSHSAHGKWTDERVSFETSHASSIVLGDNFKTKNDFSEVFHLGGKCYVLRQSKRTLHCTWDWLGISATPVGRVIFVSAWLLLVSFCGMQARTAWICGVHAPGGKPRQRGLSRGKSLASGRNPRSLRNQAPPAYSRVLVDPSIFWSVLLPQCTLSPYNSWSLGSSLQ